MRILVLIIQFPPDVNATGLLMAQVGEGLMRRGHQVSVLTAFPHYANFRVWDEFRGKLAERSSYRGMDVLRLFIYASGSKQRMRNRLLSYLSFNTLATLAGVVSREQYDCILCPNGSFFTGISATVIGAAKNIPFVYNVQDLYPETPVQAGQLRNGPAVMLLEKMERFMYAQSKHITVITPSFRENIMAKGFSGAKISVIPNFVDTEFIRPFAKSNSFSAQHDLADKFVVTHAGNLGYVYDLATFLDTAALLRAHQDIVFLIVGDGVVKPALEAKARGLGLSNVRFLPFQPGAMVPYLRATSDVQVALYRSGSARFSMPSKVYEIMASGRPVLAGADRGSDLWKLVESTGSGLCIEPHDPQRLASALLTLYRDPSLRAQMGQRGRREAEATYSPAGVVSQYDDLLRTLPGRTAA